MTPKERNETWKIASNNGWKQSAYDLNKQIKDGKTIIHIDNNRTQVDGKIHHGSSAATKAIKGS